MDGHPFQIIEQNIRPSRNFEPWKLTEPHLLVPNSKVEDVEDVCFEEGSFGLLSTPSAPDFTPHSAFYVPRKRPPEKLKSRSVRLYFGAIFYQLLMTFIRNSWTFTYDMMLSSVKESV